MLYALQTTTKGITTMNDHTTARRNSDPATSQDAAKNITDSGVRQSQASVLVAFVRDSPGETSGTYRELTGFSDTQVSRRMSDLVKAGKVHANGTGTYKGRKHQRWFPGADHEQMKPKAHCSTCSCSKLQPDEAPPNQARMNV